jgi:hypothetical protein
MFGSKKKPTMSRADALAMKPVSLVEAEMRTDDAGNGRLVVDLQPPRIARWIAPGMKRRSKTFEFDAVGVFVWNHLDGKTSVEHLIRKLAGEYKLDLRQAEASTVAFLQMLMKRGLVGVTKGNGAD